MPDATLICPYRLTLDTSVGGWSKDTAAMVASWGNNPSAILEWIDDTSVPANDPAQQHSRLTVADWYFQVLSNQGVADYLAAVFLWLDQINKLNQPDNSGSPGDILNFQLVWHRLSNPDSSVPIEYSTFTGDDPSITWRDWGTFGQSHVPFDGGDGFWYRSTLVGQSGNPLPASVFYDLIRQPRTNETGIDVMITVYDLPEQGEPTP